MERGSGIVDALANNEITALEDKKFKKNNFLPLKFAAQ